jgi:hypothetical protein
MRAAETTAMHMQAVHMQFKAIFVSLRNAC